METKYAEDIGHYWQTGSSAPDTWIEKAKRQIEEVGGTINADAYGSSGSQAAFMVAFSVEGQSYKVVIPVLESKTGKAQSAKRQAATILYHDIKAKCMISAILGTKAAFFSYMMLPDGRTASELAIPELSTVFPVLLKQQN